MKLFLALLAVGVVTAHWTHDDSLAREIGPPPGEEDVDVEALSDELISMSETTSTSPKITYRITIGTAWVEDSPTKGKVKGSWWNGGSSQTLQFEMTGRKGWSGNPDATIVTGGSGASTTLRYYQGPFMDWEKAGTMAPTLLPGLVPLLTPAGTLCAGVETGNRVKDCSTSSALAVGSEATESWDWCEPNTKACKSELAKCTGLDCTGIGYARPPATVLKDGKDADSSELKMGLIQRGQIEYEDVGEITQVTAKSAAIDQCPPAGNAAITALQCTSPWFPKFIKVNTNNAKTGVGNGIYYVHPMAGLHTSITESCTEGGGCENSDNMYVLAKPGTIADSASTLKMVTGSHNAELKKCVAQQCEEEMDAMYGLEAVKEEQ